MFWMGAEGGDGAAGRTERLYLPSDSRENLRGSNVPTSEPFQGAIPMTERTMPTSLKAALMGYIIGYAVWNVLRLQ